MHGERWDTPERIAAARARFEALIPGWRSPVVHGTALVRPGEAVVFPVVNSGAHGLPAVVMGYVVGRVDQTATYEVSQAQLDEAITLLEPAEAATMMDHPNLAAWRTMREELRRDPAAAVVTVFVADRTDPASGPYDDAMRAKLAAGSGH